MTESTAQISTESSISTKPKRTWKEEEERRRAVASLYQNHLGASHPSEWNGANGTIAKIRTIYPDMSRSMIQNVLVENMRAEKRGDLYLGQRRERTFRGKRVISPKGLSEQVIADMMEDGYGYKRTTKQVNRMRIKTGQRTVGRSTV